MSNDKIEIDHLLGHLLAASFQSMVGDKLQWIFAGALLPGFGIEVITPFPISNLYLKPLQENMEKQIKEERYLKELMHGNGCDFLKHIKQRELLKQLQAVDDNTICVLSIGSNYHGLFFGEELASNIEPFELIKIEEIKDRHYRITGQRKGDNGKEGHLTVGVRHGLFVIDDQNIYLTQKGIDLREEILTIFLEEAKKEGVMFVKTAPFDHATWQRHQKMGQVWVSELFAFEQNSIFTRFFGLKLPNQWIEDRFHAFLKPEEVDAFERRCLRFIEKWTRILQIGGELSTSSARRRKTIFRFKDSFDRWWDGPFVERQHGNRVSGSLLGSLERLMGIIIEEREPGKRIKD